MNHGHVTPYEGGEPYIFVSYSHKDNSRVLPLLQVMADRGYRIWYDAGIHAGNRWTEVISGKIADCAVFMPLHSKESIRSRFCRDEFHFAYHEQKEFVPVNLENIALPKHLKFMQGDMQHLNFFEYDSVDIFAEWLDNQPVFDQCRGTEEKTTAVEVAPVIIKPAVVAEGDGWNPDENGLLTIWRDFSFDKPDDQPWKEYRKRIQTVMVNNNVTSIGDNAFAGCTSLTGITIPNSVTSIGREAFHSCTGLTSVTIPDNVTSIREATFYDCTGLTSVIIPKSVTSIGGLAFYGCTGLTSVTIPDSVTSIDISTFGCTGLTSVTIPDSVTFIGGWTFQGCTGLAWAKVPKDLEIDKNVFPSTTQIIRY